MAGRVRDDVDDRCRDGVCQLESTGPTFGGSWKDDPRYRLIACRTVALIVARVAGGREILAVSGPGIMAVS
jgi:hypothetical protein